MRSARVMFVTLCLCGCPADRPAPAPPPRANPAGNSPFAGVSRTEIKAAFTAITKAAEGYRAEHGDWPADVQALVEGDYLRAAMANDPWGRPYSIQGQGPTVLVRTYGADGIPGGAEADTDWDSGSTELSVPGGS